MLEFDAENHAYSYDGIPLMSVTQFISTFFETFDGPAIAAKVVNKPGSPYFGRDPEEVVAEWEAKGEEGRRLGTLLHQNIQDFLEQGVTGEDCSEEFDHFLKFFDTKQWTPIFIEEKVFNLEYRIAGTIDAVFEDEQGQIVICDWKRAAKMRFDNPWRRAAPPIQHLDDCDFIKYTLQLSLYRFLLRDRFPEREIQLQLVNFTDSYREIPIANRETEIVKMLHLRDRVEQTDAQVRSS